MTLRRLSWANTREVLQTALTPIAISKLAIAHKTLFILTQSFPLYSSPGRFGRLTWSWSPLFVACDPLGARSLTTRPEPLLIARWPVAVAAFTVSPLFTI